MTVMNKNGDRGEMVSDDASALEEKLMMAKAPETTRKSGFYIAPRHSLDKKGPEQGWLPLVSGYPFGRAVARYPASGFVSAIPNCTIPRWWGGLPSRKWGSTGMRTTRHIRALRPVEIGTFGFLTHLFTFWAQPVTGMAGLADDFRERAEEERDPERALNYEILELKMRYELGEIEEEDFRLQEGELKQGLRDIREGKPGKKKKAKKNKGRTGKLTN